VSTTTRTPHLVHDRVGFLIAQGSRILGRHGLFPLLFKGLKSRPFPQQRLYLRAENETPTLAGWSLGIKQEPDNYN
jgi:hypothetical protein